MIVRRHKGYLISALTLLVALFLCFPAEAAPRQTVLTSPNGRLKAQISNRGGLSFSLSYNDKLLMEDCEISMKLDSKNFNGKGRTVNKNIVVTPVSETLHPTAYTKNEVDARFNEIRLTYKDYEVIFRAYDDGFAYRFAAFQSSPFKVMSEQADFHFAGDWPSFATWSTGYVPNDKKSFDKQYHHSFENTYSHLLLSGWPTDRLAYLPMMVKADGGICICITEADLQNYPGMYLQFTDKKHQIYSGRFAAYPTGSAQGGRHNLESIVSGREKYIAKYDSPASVTEFPWRVIAVAPSDVKMADNDLVYKLATPPEFEASFGWVRPGKALWDWWSSRMLHGVDFKCGINTQTYKHYVDFAAEHGFQYVVIGEGWSSGPQADLYQVVSGLDLRGVVEYAREKRIGILLWAGYWALSRDLEQIFDYYAKLGVEGFVVDMLHRDDQPMVEFMTRTASAAATHHLLVDFHGCCKPTGLTKTWPNVISFESAVTMEKTKTISRELDMVTNDVTLPFVRAVAGPIDYCPGAMRNASLKNFYTIYEEPMSQGTRCHQLAAAIVFHSPLVTLCDSPSNYLDNRECFDFLAGIPTVWDETRMVSGEAGEYIILSRRKGSVWYIAGLNGWTERDVLVDLGFQRGDFLVEVLQDGVNADYLAKDFSHRFTDTRKTRELPVRMAPGGGFVVRIIPNPNSGMDFSIDE